MSYYEENKERRRSNIGIRPAMDIIRGIGYPTVGCLLLVNRSFMNMSVPALIAYPLGGVMIIGGLLRLFRGVKAIMASRK